MTPSAAYLLGVATTLGGLALVWALLWLLGPWLRAWGTGVDISLTTLAAMRLRGADLGAIGTAMIVLHKAGDRITAQELEAIALTLPSHERGWEHLMRRARPALVARPEEEARHRTVH